MTATQAVSFPGMGGLGQWSPSHLTICSVYPKRLVKNLPLVVLGNLNKEGRPARTVDFILEAAPTNGYSTILVPDGFEFIRDTNVRDAHGMREAPVPAINTAERLVRHWAGDAIGAKEGLTIGVAIIAGDIPTPEELKNLRTLQENYFRWLIQDANVKWSMDDKKGEITSMHRDAASWMGDEGFPWFKMPTQRLHKKCRACAEDILREALVCKHCNTNLVTFYKSLNIVPTEEEDAAVLTVLKAMQPLPAPSEPAQVQAKVHSDLPGEERKGK